MLHGSGHFDATGYLDDPLVMPYREPAVLSVNVPPGPRPAMRDVRSFFVKETVPYLRTQRPLFTHKNFEFKFKKFLVSLMCCLCVAVVFTRVVHLIQYLFVRFLHFKEWVGGFSPFLV